MLCYQQEKPDSKESPSQRERNAKKSNVTYTIHLTRIKAEEEEYKKQIKAIKKLIR